MGEVTQVAKSSKSAKSETKITRISASDTSSKSNKKPAKTTEKTVKVKPEVDTKKHATAKTSDTKPTRKHRNIFASVARYFKGAWYELRQVRWPDRKATWSMTGALILFTLFFVVVIVLLDYGFSQLFKLIMGS